MKGTLKSLYERVEVESFPTHKEEKSTKETIANTEFKNIAAGPSDLNLKGFSTKEEEEEDSNTIEIEIEEPKKTELELINEIDLEEDEELNFKAPDSNRLIINEDDGELEEQRLINESEKQQVEEQTKEEEEENNQIHSESEKIKENAFSVLPKTVKDIINCFSIPENFKRLFNPIPGEFGSLNGLRFFSMMWVIWGHTLFFWAQIGAANIGYAYGTFVHQFYIQAAMSGIFAVDSFFFLSGFLGSYFLYERLISGKRMEWFLVYFHRFWRILPVYTFIMLIYVTMIPVLGDGPFWYKLVHIIENTSPYCWSNLIFINNMYPSSSEQVR